MNMNAKKRVNGSWVDAPYYIHKTAADTFTTLPVDVYADGNNATVGLKGNTDQSGTPTPDNPIMPQGTGERTGNLFDPNSVRYHMGKGTGNRIGAVSNGAMFYIKAVPNTEYTLKIHTTDSTFARLYLSNAPIAEGVPESYNVISESETTINPEVTISNTNYTYLWIQVGGTWYTEHGGTSIMLNTGSTALPYEPYGYKILISSANTTTPVYLGEAQATRKIKKLVLTGEEKFFRDKERADSWRFYSMPLISAKSNVSICNHFAYIGTSLVNESDTIGFSIFSTKQFGCRCPKEIANTITEFKAFLAAQYAAGTPVCVWYVLATEETGIVNEPLMKIGDYADEVSNISIPTITGKNIVDVETVLKPSEVSFNYAGWHTAVVHKRINGAWD